MLAELHNDFTFSVHGDDDAFFFEGLQQDDSYSSVIDSLNNSSEEGFLSYASRPSATSSETTGVENETSLKFQFEDACKVKRSSEKSRPYKCSYVSPDNVACERQFTKLAHLKAHYMTHTGERPFKCTEEGCGKSFTQLSTLKNHLLTHSGDKLHACPHEGCNKRFSRPSTLRNHLNTHVTERKTFVCMFDGCNKQFTQVSSLRTHLRTHTGEKPFLCPVDGCGRMFNRQSNRKRHLATHLPKQRMACNETESANDVNNVTVVSVPVNEEESVFIMPEVNLKSNPITMMCNPISMCC